MSSSVGAGSSGESGAETSTAARHAASVSVKQERGLETATICPVCFEELVEPKLLHCAHNICAKCEEQLAEEDPKRKRTRAGSVLQPKLQIMCPICTQVTVVKEGGLTINFGMRGG